MAHNTNQGRRIKSFGVPRPHTRHPRPHIWITGPDPELRKRYYAWLQQRNQALWRGEGWTIPFELWLALWGDLWALRGRDRGSMCMTRKDWTADWTPDNVHVITRSEHAIAQGHARAQGWCSQAQRRKRGRKRQGELDL